MCYLQSFNVYKTKTRNLKINYNCFIFLYICPLKIFIFTNLFKFCFYLIPMEIESYLIIACMIVVFIIIQIILNKFWYKAPKNVLTYKLDRKRKELYLYTIKNPIQINMLMITLNFLSEINEFICLLKNEDVKSPFNKELLYLLNKIRKNKTNIKLTDFMTMLNCFFYVYFDKVEINEPEINICIRMLLTILRLIYGNEPLNTNNVHGIYEKLFFIQYKFLISCRLCSMDKSFISPNILPLSIPNILLTKNGCFLQKIEFECAKCHVGLINENFTCYILQYPNYLIAYFDIIIDNENMNIEIFTIKLYMLYYGLIGFVLPAKKKFGSLNVLYCKDNVNKKWFKQQESIKIEVTAKEILAMFLKYKSVLCIYKSIEDMNLY